MTTDQLTYVGTCIAPHGVKGEIQCTISNPAFDDTDTKYFIIEIDGTFIPFYIEEYRCKSNATLLVKFDNINTLQATQKLLKHNLFTLNSQLNDFSQLPTLNSQLNDFSQLPTLIGYSVLSENNENIGKIVNTDIISTENAILLLDNDIIIPLHPDLVIDIDHINKTITMTIPDGLLDN